MLSSSQPPGPPVAYLDNFDFVVVIWIQTSNLNGAEIDALKNLKSRNDIVIKPADKGGRVVVWRKDLYIEEGLSQLENNDNFYKKKARDPTKCFNKAIINAVKEEIEKEHLPDNADQLFSNHHSKMLKIIY